MFSISFSGGSGFLGQHIIKLMQECDPHVKEIRVLDLVSYENKLGECVVSSLGDQRLQCHLLGSSFNLHNLQIKKSQFRVNAELK